MTHPAFSLDPIARCLRVRGLVQGVGFRPTVWRIANDLMLAGNVCNDGSGVLIKLFGVAATLDRFVEELYAQCPPLARIDSIEEILANDTMLSDGFHIVESQGTQVQTGVVADAATCPACLEEIRSADNRRYRYAFSNCTHCGPRFSIIQAIPYDRANTSMRHFDLCEECSAEYSNPADRRFHAQPNACGSCGPQVWLTDTSGEPIACDDAIALAAAKLKAGSIVAIKGIGGIHLACDANNANAIATLRKRKHRPHKPLALMARDVKQVRRYCQVDQQEADTLLAPAAPVVVLARKTSPVLSSLIAPGQRHWGFMLPYSPLHHLLMDELSGPIVLTSGNLSDEPQCTDNQDATARLTDIADYFLLHDRPIINRIDDSVVRYNLGKLRMLRRARGYAPAQIKLPPGFETTNGILALGGELKNTFCLLKDGHAILSQHMGDLEDARTFSDFQHNLDLYQSLYDFVPQHLVIDAHPEYVSSKQGKAWAEPQGLTLSTVQHHHAHIASCMADNGLPLDHPPILGIALDGLGMGDADTLWGGELLLADYQGLRRLGGLKPVALIGGAKAMYEPWRNTYAHLQSAGLWQPLSQAHSALPLVKQLQQQPLQTIDAMLAQKLNCPLCSSAGRLFDAVAAALALTPEQCSFEGQAAMALEALVDEACLSHESPYPFNIINSENDLLIDPKPMWQSLLKDLQLNTEPHIIATRFHKGLADTLVQLATDLSQQQHIQTVALSGGVFQNRTLFERVHQGLQHAGLKVLSHHQVPANDGGLSLGQALVAAARQTTRR